jgi:hypothetical protein
MKPGNISKRFPTSPEDITAAIQSAPERVHDPDGPYDPNDAAAVAAFWKDATVRRPGQLLRLRATQRAAGRAQNPGSATQHPRVARRQRRFP